MKPHVQKRLGTACYFALLFFPWFLMPVWRSAALVAFASLAILFTVIGAMEGDCLLLWRDLVATETAPTTEEAG